MDLSKRLETFREWCDVKAATMINQCSTVHLSKIQDVRLINSTLLQQCENQKTLEVQGIQEKLGALTDRFSKICRLAENRKRFLDELMSEFVAPMKIIEQTVERLAAEAHGHPDQLRIVQERLRAVAHDLEILDRKISNLEKLAEKAKMIVVEDENSVKIDWRKLIEKGRRALDDLTVRVTRDRDALALVDQLRTELVDVEKQCHSNLNVVEDISKGKSFGDGEERLEEIKVLLTKFDQKRPDLEALIARTPANKYDNLLEQFDSLRGEVEKAFFSVQATANLWREHDVLVSEIGAWLESAYVRHSAVKTNKELPLEVRIQQLEQLSGEYKQYANRADCLRELSTKLAEQSGVTGVQTVFCDIVEKVRNEGRSLEFDRNDLQELLNRRSAFKAIRDQLHHDLSAARGRFRDSNFTEGTLAELEASIETLNQLNEGSEAFDEKCKEMHACADALQDDASANAAEKVKKAETDVDVFRKSIISRLSELMDMKIEHQKNEKSVIELSSWLDKMANLVANLKSRPLEARKESIPAITHKYQILLTKFDQKRPELEALIARIPTNKYDNLLEQFDSLRGELEKAFFSVQATANLWRENDVLVSEIGAWLESAYVRHGAVNTDKELPLEVRLQQLQQLLDEYKHYANRADHLRELSTKLADQRGVTDVQTVYYDMIEKVSNEGRILEFDRNSLQELLNRRSAFKAIHHQLHRDLSAAGDRLRNSNFTEAELEASIEALNQFNKEAEAYDEKFKEMRVCAAALQDDVSVNAMEKVNKAERDVDVFRKSVVFRLSKLMDMKTEHQKNEKSVIKFSSWLDEMEKSVENLKSRPLEARKGSIPAITHKYKTVLLGADRASMLAANRIEGAMQRWQTVQQNGTAKQNPFISGQDISVEDLQADYEEPEPLEQTDVTDASGTSASASVESPTAAAPPNRRRFLKLVLRAALLLVLLMVLLLGAAYLVPRSDDNDAFVLANNFARLLNPMLHHLNGPPPF